MVAQFLRLKLALLTNTFRRSPVQLIGMLIGLVYGLGLAALITFGLISLRVISPDIARVLVIMLGSVVVLGFALLPLAFGVDDTLDPRRFGFFGIPTGLLATYLALAALVGVPALVIVILSLGQVVTWSRDGLSTFLAILVIPIIVATCLLLSRIASGFAAMALSSRRLREATGVVVLLVLATLAPLVAIIATLDWESHSLPILRRVAAVLTWTPFGAPWSVPADAAIGRLDEALAKLAISLIVLGLLALAWRWLVGWMLVTPQREVAQRRYLGLGWFDRLPGTPFGVIAARSLSYWSRDSRYLVAVAVIPIVPLVMTLALAIAGIPWEVIAWIPVPVMCLFLGWTVHNDIAHDSTAFWIHLSTSTSGLADRWGRLVPPLAIGVPLVLVGSVATCLISGAWETLPALIGLSSCVLLVALGVSSVTSAAFPYPTVRPGDSPFAQPQAAGTTGSLVQSLSFFASVLAAAPAVVLIVMAATSPALYWAACAAGLGIGVAVLLAGTAWGGWIVNRRSPELLEFTLQN